jgi:membrane-bound lytic murein transglycosylase D
LRRKAILILWAALWVLVSGLAAAKTDNPFEVQEKENDSGMGWEQGYVFPVSPDDIHFYDKSRPFPEIIKKFSEQTSYTWSGPPTASGAFPLTINPLTEDWVKFWSNNKKTYRVYLERSGLYSEMIKHELARRQMPQELFYLCMIESGFQNKAKSWAGARGLWQFIHGTGVRYGLRIDYWVDERCDPAKSTDAALNYLSDLYGMFGDWHLAAAAYNCGEDGVARRLGSTGCKDYWCLCSQRSLPSETRGYIPNLIGAAIVGSNLQRYGYNNIDYLAPLKYTEVTVGQATDIRAVAKCANTTTREIEFLNPELTWWCTPPGRNNYKINIPYGKAQEFYVAYSKLPNEDKTAFKSHTVKQGENVASIARSYGTRDTKMILAMNDISGENDVRVGQTIVIPVPKDRSYQDVGDYRPKSRGDNQGVVPDIKADYVKPGENKKGWRRFDRAGEVDRGDDNSKPRSVKTDRNDKADKADQPAKSDQNSDAALKAKADYLIYTIEPDDTLSEIASWAGHSSTEIKSINNIKDERSIQYGDTIRIPNDKPGVKPPPPKKDAFKIEGPTRTISYTVRPGDRCYSIARYYGIHSSLIIDKNNLDSNCSIKPNQQITLVVPKDAPTSLPPLQADPGAAGPQPASSPSAADSKSSAGSQPASAKTSPPASGKKTVYLVKTGDTLWQIARNHDAHVADILKWNSIDAASVSPGQKLTIYPGGEYKGPFVADTSDKSKPPVKDPKAADKPADKPADKTTVASADKTKAPSAAGLQPTSSAPKCADPKTYIVKNGDSIKGIAKSFGCSPDDIRVWNKLSSDAVSVNQKLLVCGSADSSPKPKAPDNAAAPKDTIKESKDAPKPAATSGTEGKKKIEYVVKDGESLWQVARNNDVHVADIKTWNNLPTDAVKPGQKLIIYVDK